MDKNFQLLIDNRVLQLLDCDMMLPKWLLVKYKAEWSTASFVCLSGLHTLIPTFMQSGTASPVFVSISKVWAPNGLCTLISDEPVPQVIETGCKPVL